MASGDTKTEAMLNALGNGGSADEFRGCCNTKTQQYILDAIDRVQNVEDEVEELKNNPDVVDIVDTYADLQAYDTQHLTENDIIRVLQDETHDGNSTYYRFTKNPDTWTFVGEIAGGGGGGVTELTPADYNWPTNNPTSVALWLLPSGVYTATSETTVRANNSSYIGDVAQGCFVVGYGVGSTEIVRLYAGEGNPRVYLTATSTGAAMTLAGYKGGKILTDGNLAQATGTSTTNVMSQKAVTDMVFADGDSEKRVKIGKNSRCYNDGGVAIGSYSQVTAVSGIAIGGSGTSYEGTYNTSPRGIAIGINARTTGGAGGLVGYECIAIGNNASTQTAGRGAIALGTYSIATEQGQMDISTLATTNTYGYNNSQYRLLTGLYDPQSAHDAATKGYVDAISSYSETEVDTGATWIDGKTIYKKSYSQTIAGNSQTFNLNITNLYEIVKIEAIWHTGGTLTNGLPTTFATPTSLSDSVSVITYGGMAEITSSGRSGTKGVITFYYTKSS